MVKAKLSPPSSQGGFSTQVNYAGLCEKGILLYHPAQLVHTSTQFGFGWFPLYHQWSQSQKITGANPMVASCWVVEIPLHHTTASPGRVGSKTHLLAHALLGYKVKCSKAPTCEQTLLDFAQSCILH